MQRGFPWRSETQENFPMLGPDRRMSTFVLPTLVVHGVKAAERTLPWAGLA